jgi:hypothetical protein
MSMLTVVALLAGGALVAVAFIFVLIGSRPTLFAALFLQDLVKYSAFNDYFLEIKTKS